MEKFSYCKKHDTYPQDDEPCWACIRRFGYVGGNLTASEKIAEENQQNTKPCRVDGETLCVQHPEEDECNCDPCEDCGVKLIYTQELQGIIRKLMSGWNENEIYPDDKPFDEILEDARKLLGIKT